MTFTETLALIWVFILAFVCMLLKAGAKETPQQRDEKYYRRAVEIAGGVYVGIQKCDIDHSLDCVLFNSQKTGSTLAIKVSNFSAVGVENRIEKHNHDWEVAQENAHVII